MKEDNAPFVGRERELDELVQRLSLVRRGQGGIVLVSGDPGIGKTRLAQEVAAAAEGQGGIVLWGRCWQPEMGAPALWPWSEALATCVRTLDPDVVRVVLKGSVSELARLVPEFRGMVSYLNPEEPEEPEEARFRLLRAVTEFLRQLASAPRAATPTLGLLPLDTKPPLLVVLDDLHWADKASLLLLQYIAHERGPIPFLVIGVYDDSALDQAHPLKSTVAALQREATVRRIELQGLKARDVRALVEARLGLSASSGRAPRRRMQTHALAQMLHQASDGNPLFVTEMMNHLMQDTTALDRDWHSIQAIPGAGLLVMPANVREMMERRLAHLSDDLRQVLNVAAVVGRDFDATILATATAMDAERLDTAVGEAEAAAVIVPVGYGERFRFRHALVRQALYDSMPTRPRLRLHRLIAEAIESRFKDDSFQGKDDHVSELAYHFGQVGDAEKTRLYSRLAGERAEQATAWEEAARQYNLCLTLTQHDGTSERTEQAALLVAMGRCWRNANDQRTAWRCFMQAISLFEQVGDGIGVANAALEALRIAAPPDRRDSMVDRALAALGDRDPRLEAQLQLQRALFVHSDDEVEESHRRAAELAEQHGMVDVATVLEQVDGNRALRDGRPDEARRIFERLYESCVRLGIKGWALGFFISANSIPLFAGALDEGEECVRRAAGFAGERHNRLRQAGLLTWLAGTAFARGELDRYATLLDRSVDLNPANFSSASLRALSYEVAGEVDRALTLAPGREQTGGFPSWLALVYGARARIRFHAGDIDGAREDLTQWEQHRTPFRLAEGAPNYLHTLTWVDDVLPALGREALVEEVYAELLQWSWARFAPANACSIDQLRGALALRLGRLEAAERHYIAGQGWAEREGCRIELGRCLMGRAKVAVRLGRSSEALELLERASIIFEESGAGLYLRQAAEEIARISQESVGEPEREPSWGAPHGSRLSARELEVLRLMCDGQTNQQIAEQLSISPNTVGRHVTHIFNKTGTSNRAAAVSHALRQHLVSLQHD